jgi:DNA modification methylase
MKTDQYTAKDFSFRKACPEIPNTSYLTHKIHSYPAKFIPHIPRWFLKEYGRSGDTILDPFCGSGTALVEANLLGINALGIDINPLAQMLLKAKTGLADNHDKFSSQCLHVVEQVHNYPASYVPDLPNLDTWFLPQARQELAKIFGYLLENPDQLPDRVVNFMLVCASSIVRKVCNADPQISKPFISKRMRVLLKENAVEQRALHLLKINAKLFLDRKIKYMRTIANLSEIWGHLPTSEMVMNSDARTLRNIDNQSIDSIITSPPYANAQEYFRSIKMELYWLNLLDGDRLKQLNKDIVGTESLPISECRDTPKFGIDKLDLALEKVHLVDQKRAHIVLRYFQDMQASIQQCYRVLKPGAYFGLLVGDNVIRKIKINTHLFLQEIAEATGFSTEIIGYDRIVARRLTPKRNVSAGLIEVEWMLIFRKPGL